MLSLIGLYLGDNENEGGRLVHIPGPLKKSDVCNFMVIVLSTVYCRDQAAYKVYYSNTKNNLRSALMMALSFTSFSANGPSNSKEGCPNPW